MKSATFEPAQVVARVHPLVLQFLNLLAAGVGEPTPSTGCDCCLNADPQREHVVICRNGTCTVLGIPTTTARRWLYIEDGVLGWGIP